MRRDPASVEPNWFGTPPADPVKRLWQAVLAQAVMDIKSPDPDRRDAAISWLTTKDFQTVLEAAGMGIDPDIARRKLQNLGTRKPRRSSTTTVEERSVKVVSMFSEGHTVKAIGRELGLGHGTVKKILEQATC